MRIETVIREQESLIERLWCESVEGSPVSAAVRPTTLASRLRQWLATVCNVLENGRTADLPRKLPRKLPPQLIEGHVTESRATGNPRVQVVWDYALIERCTYQAWAMSLGGWPPEQEGRRLRSALHTVAALALEHLAETRVSDEHDAERRSLDALDQALQPVLQNQPAVAGRACLSAVRRQFGPSATATLVFFAEDGAVIERVWDGPGLPHGAVDELARRASRERDLVVAEVDDSALGLAFAGTGVRVLTACSLPLAGNRRAALLLGGDVALSQRDRRLLRAIGSRLAHLLDVAERDALARYVAERDTVAREELHRMTDERSLRERFVDALAHDLRGPLMVAKLSVDMLLPKLRDGEMMQYARRVARAVEHAEGMLRDLLDASRVRAGQPLPLQLGPCDLSAVVTELVDEIASVHAPRLVLKAESSVVGVWCAQELRRAVWNLIMNALRHGARDRPVIVEVAQADGGARISVQNDGPAIAHDVLGRIFDPYRRLAGGGWGLGLTLVQACAEAHGGTVTVTSAEGKPTIFTLSLPRDSRTYYDALLRRSEVRQASTTEQRAGP
jgi:signal transduction histidine kinase